MRLLIDMQGAQSESRFRGIGRQASAFASAIVAQAGRHDVYLLVNGAMRDGLDALRREYSGVLPPDRIKVFGVSGPVHEIDQANLYRMRIAELAREAFIAQIEPDVVHINSVFEGVGDDSVTSIGLMAAPYATSATLHDLIPLYDEPAYLGAEFMRNFFYRRLQSLKRADLLLAVSESAKREAIEMLQFPADRIEIALNAADDRFRAPQLGADGTAALRRRYGLPDRFVLYVGAIEPRKNIPLIIEAFGKLPEHVQADNALVFGGKLHENERLELLASAVRFGVDTARIVLPGFISDDDLPALYGICDLFVFPSMQEGFGLPPLEAMACGAPVLVARNSSLPEVVGRDDLMFGTFDAADLARKMHRIMTEPDYAASLRTWSLERAATFSWKETGRKALESFEALHERHVAGRRTVVAFGRKRRLAFVSPLPGDRSGIADYGVELLRELGCHYDVECVIDGSIVTDPWVRANFVIRDVAYFRRHANSYDRIVYQVGNSEFHAHMFELIEDFPGTVVLHDFFLSGIFDWLGNVGRRPPEDFLRELYLTHGLTALHYAKQEGRHEAASRYPTNHVVFANAQGVVVHSDWAMKRAREIYGDAISGKMVRLPLLRAALPKSDKRAARRRLGLTDDAFVVCSFGFVAETKLGDRLIDAWLETRASRSEDAHLIFAGDHPLGPWGEAFSERLEGLSGRGNIRVTGFLNAAAYDDYLAAADVAVQLRQFSRGETSRAVLDAMAGGLAVIVNAHGTLAELPDYALVKIPDRFATETLADAIDTLFADRGKREALGRRGRDELIANHHPTTVADHLREAIERFATVSPVARCDRLLEGIREVFAPVYPHDDDFARLSGIVAQSVPRVGLRRILFDITLLAVEDSHTGIQRVVRGMMRELVNEPPEGYRVEPVRLDHGRLRFARCFTAKALGIPADVLPDDPVDYDAGDIYLMLEWAADLLPGAVDWLQDFRRHGGTVVIGINDLLPLEIPHRFPPHIGGVGRRWFESVLAVADQLVCISRCVADTVLRYGTALATPETGPIAVGYYHLASDIRASIPTRGLPPEATSLLDDLRARKTFLMVGTVEPRKGHRQVVEAFQALWAEGVDVTLVVVGKTGWSVEATERLIAGSRENGKRLFRMTDVSDEYLELLYGASTALIAASEAEGFGLPLIEAATYKLPLIVRDIPVFREVAGAHAYYFDGFEPADLAAAIRNWLALADADRAPGSWQIKPLRWKESAAQLIAAISDPKPYGVIDVSARDRETTP